MSLIMMEGRFPYAGLGLMTPSLLLGLHGVPLPLALLGTWSRPLCVIRSTLATIGLGRHFFFFSFCSSPFIYSPNLFRYGSSGVQRLKTVWSPLEDRVISVSCRPPRDGSDEAKRPEYPHSRRSIDCLTPVSCCLAFSWQTSQPSFSRPNAPGMGK
ncbi:hypothetical protein VUR80DRAFT_769 [Thermomyces stellatus]